MHRPAIEKDVVTRDAQAGADLDNPTASTGVAQKLTMKLRKHVRCTHEVNLVGHTALLAGATERALDHRRQACAANQNEDVKVAGGLVHDAARRPPGDTITS